MSVNQLSGNVNEIVIKPRRVFVIEDNPKDKIILVDTGDVNTAEELVNTIDEEFQTIDYVYLTHAGPDHYGGLNAIVEAFDPDVYAPVDEIDLIEAIDQEPDVLFEDSDILPGNIEVIQIAGHSPSTSALLLHEENALISGDVLDGADRRGLPEGYLLPPPEIYNHNHRAAEQGLERLLEYEFTSVFVFHGSHVHEDARKKIDQFVNFKKYYQNKRP